MFSFIHTADIHLDSPLRGLNQHENAPVEQIRGATRRALENLVECALENEVDFLLIAGDLYDGDWPDYNTGLFFNKQMKRLEEVGIPVYIISGNHDAASKITKSLIPPRNVRMLSTDTPETLLLDTLSVAIHGQGFATQSVPDNIVLEYPEAHPDYFNIGMLHTSLSGDAEHDTYAPCKVSDLTEKGYDYWALGHIHQRAVLQEHPHILYCGNPQGRHIKETGERGCYLIEVDDDGSISKTDFIVTDVARWESLEIDVSPCTEKSEIYEAISDQMEKALEKAGGRLLALRITLIGDSELHNELHAGQAGLQAECVSIAAGLDEELIWFEQLRIKTSPTYDPQELAKRDELTKLVLEALGQLDPKELPKDVGPLAKKLNGIDNKELKQLLNPSEDSESLNEQLKEDITAIVLQSISTSMNG